MNLEELLTGLTDVKVKALEIQPNDVLVLLVPERLNYALVEKLKEQMQANLPGVRTMILDSGMTLGVLREKQSEPGWVDVSDVTK